MFLQLLISTACVIATLIVHVAFVGVSVLIHSRVEDWLARGFSFFKRILALLILTLWLMAGLSVAVWIWAALYLVLGIFEDLETAIYFSTVAFTTLGFGDITLEGNWRILSAVMAANGLILFSLTTAFLIEMVRRLVPERSNG